nr:PREDICTED: laminin subunit alpha-5-like [Apteryx mantelli mantelli]
MPSLLRAAPHRPCRLCWLWGVRRPGDEGSQGCPPVGDTTSPAVRGEPGRSYGCKETLSVTLSRPGSWEPSRAVDSGPKSQCRGRQPSKRDCIEKFGLHTVDRITKDDHAICTTEYSRIVPLENGEIVVSLVNGRPGAMNFSYSPLLRNFTKATNIRLRFLQTNTLLGHLMGKALRDPTVTRRYYYSIKDISIGGRCVCHGHADVCDAKDPNDPYR